MKQTATEWLFQKLWNTDKDKFTWYSMLEQAKQIEEEQIVNAFEEGQKQVINLEGNWYYNETYNNDKT
tara:strand:- start:463 stop:666 length:204 start_codon:yes stop_codon:yes gene_type:complete